MHWNQCIFFASTVINNPRHAIKVKDHLKLAICAMLPMSGGPSKNPIKPMVETAARATPGFMVLDLPAALYISGITEDTPRPTIKKPMPAGMMYGKITDIISPVAINAPLACKTGLMPNLVVNLSEINRPVAMAHINNK